jgi:mRNA interferase YafQ
MRSASYSTRFERDLRLAEKRGKDINKLKRVLALLLTDIALPASLSDHALQGKWVGHRDLHVEPDWVLIYKIEGDTVRFERTGTHSDLFKS